jgi:hypothetical protein
VSTKPSIRSRMKRFGSARTDAAGAPPAVGATISVMFRSRGGTFDATIVGLLASQRGRRIALVRLAVENGPRQDDFHAPWFPQRPGVEEWAEVAQFPASLQQACFPREKDGGS